jgi:MFS family permease
VRCQRLDRRCDAGDLGITGAVFGVVGVSLRQAIVPDPLMGRVVSAFRMLSYGVVPVGAIMGGAVARTLGLRAPFLLGTAVLVLAALMAFGIACRQPPSR